MNKGETAIVDTLIVLNLGTETGVISVEAWEAFLYCRSDTTMARTITAINPLIIKK
jgi:hypothetical protein